MKNKLYEEKMNYLEDRLEPLKKLLKAWSCLDENNPIKKETEESIKKHIDIVECIMEDVNQMHQLEEQLKILDILKNIIVVVPNIIDTAGPKYYIKIRSDVILNDEAKEIIIDWLNYEKYDKI